MKWPPSNHDLNPIENLQLIVKVKLYESGKQYNSNVILQEAIKTTMSEIEPSGVKRLTKSMHNK